MPSCIAQAGSGGEQAAQRDEATRQAQINPPTGSQQITPTGQYGPNGRPLYKMSDGRLVYDDGTPYVPTAATGAPPGAPPGTPPVTPPVGPPGNLPGSDPFAGLSPFIYGPGSYDPETNLFKRGGLVPRPR